uniref:Uncharacterized protein n=1 Tax=Anguilla anguilla TaxID=7936 RepID=A0A0E9V8J5_ANGAN
MFKFHMGRREASLYISFFYNVLSYLGVKADGYILNFHCVMS